MTMEEFELAVEEAVRDIPKKFKRILEKENIKVLARECAPEAVTERYRGGVVFGMFIGAPYRPGGTFYPAEPTRIEIYKESFERVFSDDEVIRAHIKKTVIHEIAHYFGFGEDYLRKIGYG